MTTPSPWAARTRWALWASLLFGWLVMLPMLWEAFSTVPSPERLAQRRAIEIPTLGSVARIVVGSGIELVVVLALLFPGRPHRYLARLWIAALGAWIWFFATTPMDLARVTWVHRRWLAVMGAVLLVAAGVASVTRLVTGRGRGEPGVE